MPRNFPLWLFVLSAVLLTILAAGCTTGTSPVSETPAPGPIPAPPTLPTPQPIPTFETLPTPEPLPTVPSISTADDPAVSCTADSDCVPRECCHPTSCENKAYKHVCTLMCTDVCQGPVDCGAGHCGCVSGRCSVGTGPAP